MRKTLIIVSFIIISSTPGLCLSWNEVASLGENSSHDLNAAQKQLESKEWSFRKAYSTFMPQLSASAGYGESNQVGSDTTTKSYNYGLSATQNLFQGMSEYYGVESAYANLEYQRADLQAIKALVFYELRASYVDLMTAQENIRLLKKILDQRRQNSKMLQLRYDSGREDKGNLMSTKADEARANYELISAKRDLDLAWLKLSQLLNVDVSGEIEPIEPSNAEEVDLHNIAKQAPDQIKAKKTLELAEISQKDSISGFLPTLSVKSSYSKSGAEWPPDTSTRSWSLSLSYSLFPGISSIADRAIAGADLDKAKENYAQTSNDTLYGLKSAYQSYLNALDALEVSKTSLAASAERSKITEVKYLNGLSTYDEWSRLQDTYIQSQKSMLSAERAALIAEAAWHKSYGGWIK